MGPCFLQTPPANAFRRVEQDPYNSLPRQNSVNNNNNVNSRGSTPGSVSVAAGSVASPGYNKRGVGFGKHFQLPSSLRTNSKRSSSAPNLGDSSSRDKQFVVNDRVVHPLAVCFYIKALAGKYCSGLFLF